MLSVIAELYCSTQLSKHFFQLISFTSILLRSRVTVWMFNLSVVKSIWAFPSDVRHYCPYKLFLFIPFYNWPCSLSCCPLYTSGQLSLCMIILSLSLLISFSVLFNTLHLLFLFHLHCLTSCFYTVFVFCHTCLLYKIVGYSSARLF